MSAGHLTRNFSSRTLPCSEDGSDTRLPNGSTRLPDLLMTQARKPQSGGVVTLRAVAQHIGLTSSTVSAVLNDTPAAEVMPQRTKDRVLGAARELNYRPNFFAPHVTEEADVYDRRNCRGDRGRT
jgi:Bacterial regulatory proteins, lacI family